MIEEIASPQIVTYATAFPSEQVQVVLDAIVAGNTAARLWVCCDDTHNALLLWDQGNNVFYLAGQLSQPAQRQELAALLGGTVRRGARALGRDHFKTHALDPDLEPWLPELFAGIRLHRYPERLYRFRAAELPQVAAPQITELELLTIDQQFLTNPQIQNLNWLREEIEWMWPREQRFWTHGFGCAAVRHQQLIGWCTAEYVSPRACGIGVASEQQYQGRGLATATAAACLEQALQRGLTPYWECVANNLASRRVAEKLGFSLIDEPVFWLGTFSAN